MFQEKILKKYEDILKTNCKQCKDSNILCQDCFKKMIVVQNYVNAGVPLKYIDLGLNIFLKNEGPNQTLTDTLKKKRKTIYDEIVNYILNIKDNINKGKGVLFSGGFGTGKSTLSMNIIKEACKLHYNAKVREFCEIVKIAQTGFDMDNNSVDIMQELTNTDVYCIENIDWVYQKSDFVPLLFDNIISIASKYSIPLIITTNMKIKDINKNFNEHVYSVLHELCNIYEVPGIDVRMQKNKNFI